MTIALAFGLAACAPLNERHVERVLGVRHRTDVAHRPELDSTEVVARAVDSDVVVHVAQRRVCAITGREERLIERTVEKKPGVTALVIEGGILATMLTVTGITNTEMAACKDNCSDETAVFFLSAVGAGLAGLAVVADASKFERTTQVIERRGPSQRRLTDCPPLSRPLRVTLVLPDGEALHGTVDARGQAAIRVPEPTWQRHGSELDVDVRIDDRLIRRAVLRRAP